MRTHIRVVGIIHVVYNLLAVLTVIGFVGLWIGTSGAIGVGTTLSGDLTPTGGAALGGLLAIAACSWASPCSCPRCPDSSAGSASCAGAPGRVCS